MSNSNKGYRSTLWEIRSPNYTTPSFLFGTIHLGHPSILTRLPEVERLIENCDILALEHNLDRAKKSALANLQMPENLSTIIGTKKFDKANTICKKAFNVDLRLFESVFPIQTLNYLSIVAIKAQGSTPMDMQLWQIAKNLDKECIGLETLQKTREIFDQIDLDFQIKQLLGALRNIKTFKKKIGQTLQMYEQNQIDKIYKTGKASLGKHRKLLLYDRNAAMVNTSKALMSDNSVFIAVGAAHLWGQKGMLSYLKRNGFRLKPL